MANQLTCFWAWGEATHLTHTWRKEPTESKVLPLRPGNQKRKRECNTRAPQHPWKIPHETQRSPIGLCFLNVLPSLKKLHRLGKKNLMYEPLKILQQHSWVLNTRQVLAEPFNVHNRSIEQTILKQFHIWIKIIWPTPEVMVLHTQNLRLWPSWGPVALETSGSEDLSSVNTLQGRMALVSNVLP